MILYYIMKLLVTVMSCHKNWHLWDDIKNKIKKDLIIFSYSPKKENWYDEKERILYLNCRDTYECLPEKVICMIEQILGKKYFNDITHILKIDDYDASKLTENKIKNLYKYSEIKNGNYIGQNIVEWSGSRTHTYHYGKVSINSEWHNKPYNGVFVPWLNGGKSYILSRKAMQCINKEYNSKNLDLLYKNEIYEDLMISKLLYRYEIYPTEILYNIVD